MTMYEIFNNNIKILSIILMAYFSCKSVAFSYDWPIMTNAAVSFNVANAEITVTADIGSVRINDPTITGDELVSVVMRKKGVSVPSTDSASIGIFHDMADDAVCMTADKTCAYVQQPYAKLSASATTFKEMTEIASAIIGQKYRKTVRWDYNALGEFPVCFGFVYDDLSFFRLSRTSTIKNSSVWWAGDFGANANGCYSVNITNPDEYCMLVTPSVDFQFGTVSRKNIANAAVTKNIQVSCTSDVKYKLRLLGPTNLQLSNGMSAAFTFNGMAESSTIQGQEGLNNVSVTATLVDYNESIATGAFQGDGVFMLNYP